MSLVYISSQAYRIRFFLGSYIFKPEQAQEFQVILKSVDLTDTRTYCLTVLIAADL